MNLKFHILKLSEYRKSKEWGAIIGLKYTPLNYLFGFHQSNVAVKWNYIHFFPFIIEWKAK